MRIHGVSGMDFIMDGIHGVDRAVKAQGICKTCIYCYRCQSRDRGAQCNKYQKGREFYDTESGSKSAEQGGCTNPG